MNLSAKEYFTEKEYSLNFMVRKTDIRNILISLVFTLLFYLIVKAEDYMSIAEKYIMEMFFYSSIIFALVKSYENIIMKSKLIKNNILNMILIPSIFFVLFTISFLCLNFFLPSNLLKINISLQIFLTYMSLFYTWQTIKNAIKVIFLVERKNKKKNI